MSNLCEKVCVYNVRGSFLTPKRGDPPVPGEEDEMNPLATLGAGGFSERASFIRGIRTRFEEKGIHILVPDWSLKTVFLQTAFQLRDILGMGEAAGYISQTEFNMASTIERWAHEDLRLIINQTQCLGYSYLPHPHPEI